jgi:Uma2 family endonuclease
MVGYAKRKIEEVFYPESDGKPMADNTKQWNWIVTIKEGCEVVYQHEFEVFVAGDMLWYPVKGSPNISQAPDTMIALGRPKGHRGSYKQWEEGDTPPQVVFEVWSPGNKRAEKEAKRLFYEKYGVEEYYEFDPDRLKLGGWLRKGAKLVSIANMQGWVSPLTRVKFELHPQDRDKELKLYQPDGKPFLTFLERARMQEQAEQARLGEQQARLQAEQKLQDLIAKLQAQGIKIPE